MIRTLRRTTAALVVALIAVVATTLGASPARADDQPILPILKLLAPPRATPTPAPAKPTKPAASPKKHTSAKPAKHAHHKKRAKHTATPTRSVTTVASSVVSAPTTPPSTPSPVRGLAADRSHQVAAPRPVSRTPVQPAAETPAAAPAAIADLVSSRTSNGALPLWVPAGLVGTLVVLTGGVLWNRRRNGSF